VTDCYPSVINVILKSSSRLSSWKLTQTEGTVKFFTAEKLTVKLHYGCWSFDFAIFRSDVDFQLFRHFICFLCL